MSESTIMPDFSLQGLKNFELGPPKIQSSPRKLDTISQSFQSDREDVFLNSRIFPGYPLMEIEEVETVIEYPGQAYVHNLRARGLLQAKAKCESTQMNRPAEGWDEIPETWLTHNPDAFVVGSAHPDHPNVFLESIDSNEKVTDKIRRCQLAYKGIILDSSGNIKPEKWKGTVNGETINSSNDVSLTNTSLFVDENGVFNGFAGFRARFDASRIILTVTRLSLTPPPTEKVGMQLTPGHVPVTVYSIFDDPGWTSAAGFTANYPPGWKLASVQFDQVLKKNAFLYTLSYEYQPKYVPTL